MQNLTKRKNNKKGLSNILTALIIIVISLLAVSLVGYYLYSFASAPSLSPKISCIDLQSKNEIKIQSACLNKDTKDIEITLKRAFSGNEIDNIRFALDSEVWQCTNSCGNCLILSPGQEKTYFLNSNNPNAANSNLKVYVSTCLLDEKVIDNC